MAGEKKLFLLDGMALAYRAYFAMIRSPRITSSGVNTSALFGFANVLLDVLNSQEPTHIAVAFDTAEPTERHELYPEYKAQREAIPEDLADALPHIFRLLESFNISVIRAPGFEADDIIGTLARKAESAGFVTYMMTPDKDFAQLVSERTYLYKPGRSGGQPELMGVAEICEKWGVERPAQVIDVLGLWGDSSDNIPGIPGIGEKTAKKLVGAYGSVEELIAHVDELKGKQQENVRQFAEQALLAKRLVTIHCDVPVEVAPDELRRTEPQWDAVRQLFAEFEFRTLGKRLFGDGFSQAAAGQLELFGAADEDGAPGAASGKQTIDEVAHAYHLADTAAARADLVGRLRRASAFCFDLETTSLDPKVAEIVGIAFAVKPHEAFYVPVPAEAEAARRVLGEFEPLLSHPKIEKIGHHLKFDIGVLRWQGIEVNGPLFDTMLAHALLVPEMRHGMDALAEAYLDYVPVPIEALIGRKDEAQRNMRDVPVEDVLPYAAEDADVTLQLRDLFLPRLREKEAERILVDVECPLIPVLVAMEHEGITIDQEALQSYSVKLGHELDALEKQIVEQAGVAFNIDSPKQLGHVLFNVLNLVDKPKKTRSGQYATSEQVLAGLAAEHQIVRDVLEYRQLRKLKNTYLDTLPETVFTGTGRVHTDYNQAVVVTGRIQSNNPNLQNIPIRTERGREIRRAFVARDEQHCLISADYSQIELRVIASLSGDPGMRRAFADGEDIHRTTAARIYGALPELVSDEMRRRAKMVNFGIAYGISAYGLAQRLGIPQREAKFIIEHYFHEYPGVKAYMEDTIEFAREHGYVRTLLGRRRYLPDINSRNGNVRAAAERNAINSPIQGTAAEMIKLAMVHIHEQLTHGQYRTRMLLQVHDELLFEAPLEEVDEVLAMIIERMTTALPLAVPVEVDTGVGQNWLEAH